MRCPQCGRSIAAAAQMQCPSCGLSLETFEPGAAASLELAPAATMEASSAMSSPQPEPALTAVGASVAPPWPQGYPPAPYRYPAPGYPQLPQDVQSGYAPPSAPPSAPPYLQTIPPGGSPGHLPYPWGAPPAPPTPQRKSRAPLIITLVVIGAVLLCSGAGLTLFAVEMSTGKFAGTSRGTTGPRATSATTPTDNIIFQDPLTSNLYGWGEDSHCFFQSGGYHVKDAYNCYAPVGEMAKLDVSVQVKQIAGQTRWPYGIVFRRTSQGNYYGFSIDANGKWKASLFVNQQESVLVPFVPNRAIRSGLNETNTLEVRAIGAHFEFFANGVRLGQADDSTFPSGRVGVSGNAGGVEVVYTNIAIGIPQ